MNGMGNWSRMTMFIMYCVVKRVSSTAEIFVTVFAKTPMIKFMNRSVPVIMVKKYYSQNKYSGFDLYSISNPETRRPKKLATVSM